MTTTFRYFFLTWLLKFLKLYTKEECGFLMTIFMPKMAKVDNTSFGCSIIKLVEILFYIMDIYIIKLILTKLIGKLTGLAKKIFQRPVDLDSVCISYTENKEGTTLMGSEHESSTCINIEIA